MSRSLSDRLTGSAWKARLRDLLHDCAASAPAEQADRIREAQALLWLRARQDGCAVDPVPGMKKLDNLLALGAHESAVISLVGGETAFMLSQGANGNCLASVVMPDGSEVMVAEASTLALALLAAHLASLLADVELMPGDPAGFRQSAPLRLN